MKIKSMPGGGSLSMHSPYYFIVLCRTLPQHECFQTNTITHRGWDLPGDASRYSSVFIHPYGTSHQSPVLVPYIKIYASSTTLRILTQISARHHT